MRQAIVTGSTGFIGSFLVSDLISNGVEVIALGRKSWDQVLPTRQQKLLGAHYVQVEMKEIRNLPRILEHQKIRLQNDCVFYNFAWWGLDKVSDFNVKEQVRNVVEGHNALLVSEQLGCRAFVQVGSMEEAFAEAYLDLDFNEVSYKNRHIVYALAKKQAKTVLFSKAKRLSLDFMYGINSHVMGVDDPKDSFLQVTLQKMMDGSALEFSSGLQNFDVIDVRDCATAYRLIGSHGRGNETYWVGSGQPRPLKQYVQEMAKEVLPAQPLQFGVMSFNDVVVPLRAFDNSRLVFDTGFSPRYSFRDSVIELRNHLERLSQENAKSD